MLLISNQCKCITKCKRKYTMGSIMKYIADPTWYFRRSFQFWQRDKMTTLSFILFIFFASFFHFLTLQKLMFTIKFSNQEKITVFYVEDNGTNNQIVVYGQLGRHLTLARDTIGAIVRVWSIILPLGTLQRQGNVSSP